MFKKKQQFNVNCNFFEGLEPTWSYILTYEYLRKSFFIQYSKLKTISFACAYSIPDS